MSISASLSVRGFTIKPWHHLPDDERWRLFYRHPFDGLFNVQDDALRIVAIMSDTGTGKLGALMDEIEAAADECGLRVEVIHFWNTRLRRWFGRRGYALRESKELGKFARRE